MKALVVLVVALHAVLQLAQLRLEVLQPRRRGFVELEVRGARVQGPRVDRQRLSALPRGAAVVAASSQGIPVR